MTAEGDDMENLIISCRTRLAASLAVLVLAAGTSMRCEAQTSLGSLLGRILSPGSQQQQPVTPQDRDKASDDAVNKGLGKFNRGDYNNALSLFQQALSYNPSNSYAYNDIGACYINLGQEDAAVPYLREAITLNPTDKTTIANVELVSDHKLDQGNDLINHGNYYQAAIVLRQAIGANPLNSMAYNDLGCAYMDMKQWNQAIPCLAQAIHVGTTSKLPYRNLGISYDQTSAADAIPYYTHALQIDPTDSEVWGWRGYDHAVTGQTSAALYDYKKSLQLKPSADVYHWRGNLELSLGQDAAGYADLRESRSLNPNLGPEIAADIKSIIAERTQKNKIASSREKFVAQERRIESIVAEGPRYYQAVYTAAKENGDSEQEADQLSEQARENYNRDVALQNAWEAGDYDTLNKIEAGEMSNDEIEAYNPSGQSNSGSDESPSENDNSYQPSDNEGSMSSGGDDAPAEAPVDTGGGDD